MKVEPAVESTDPLVAVFGVTPGELTNYVELYRQRKLAEDIEQLDNDGGTQNFEEKLKTSFKNGLSNNEDHTDRIKIFGSNKPEKGN